MFLKLLSSQVQELEKVLLQKDNKINSLVSTNASLSKRLSQTE